MTIDHAAREMPQTRAEMIEEFHAARCKRHRSPERPSFLPSSNITPKAVAVVALQRDLARTDSDQG